MHLSDVDPIFLQCVSYLHATDNHLVKGDVISLQQFLEESIKNKSGIIKDLTHVISSSITQRNLEEYKPVINILEETKGSSSDNELELDLLKEDLMCIVCNEMDVGARNRLLECSDCHALYHQECHKPIVTIQDTFDTWICQTCKDVSKKLKLTSNINSINTNTSSNIVVTVASSSNSPVSNTQTLNSSKIVVSSSKPTSSSSHRHSSTSSGYKSSGSSSGSTTLKSDKHGSGSNNSKPSSTAILSTSSKSITNTAKVPLLPTTAAVIRTNIVPNINIISADKRLQIMKKKAAKLQEKRKHLSR